MSIGIRSTLTLAACAVAAGLLSAGPGAAQDPIGAWSLHGHWVPTTPAQGLPADAVRAGTEGAGTPVHVCRAISDGIYAVGKIVGGYCYAPVDGREAQFQQYEALAGTASDALWGSVSAPLGRPFVADPFSGDVHVCRGVLNLGGAPIGLEAGVERRGQCLVSWRSQVYPLPAYQILYQSAPMGAPNPYATQNPYPAPTPGPYPTPSPYQAPTPNTYPGQPPYPGTNSSPYPAPSQYPPSPPARTTQIMDGYVTFGGGCVGKGDEHLQLRMAGRPDDERLLVFRGDGKLHMFVPRGTTYKIDCGRWPDPGATYKYRTLD